MLINRDFSDLLAELSARGAEYLIVGAYALAAHGHIRATKDLDIWINPSPENALRVFAALAAFGAPVEDLTEDDLATEGTIFQIGVEPYRIDVITRVDGLAFGDAWGDRVTTQYGDLSVWVIGRDDLIRNKKASGRLQDLADVEKLQND